MTTYESTIKTISSAEEVVFNILSDFTNLEKIQDKLPESDAIKDLAFDRDSCSFQLSGMGKVGFRITSREAYNTIVLKTEYLPVEAEARIDLQGSGAKETQMKLSLSAELPMMIKMMLDKKLKEGIDLLAGKLAEALSESAQ